MSYRRRLATSSSASTYPASTKWRDGSKLFRFSDSSIIAVQLTSVLAIAERVIEECVTIAGEKGIHLETDEVVEKLLLISKSSDGQLISTFQDILHKRQTEIETLNFAIVDIAENLNKGKLVKETKLLGELTRLKSDLSKNQTKQ